MISMYITKKLGVSNTRVDGLVEKT